MSFKWEVSDFDHWNHMIEEEVTTPEIIVQKLKQRGNLISSKQFS